MVDWRTRCVAFLRAYSCIPHATMTTSTSVMQAFNQRIADLEDRALVQCNIKAGKKDIAALTAAPWRLKESSAWYCKVSSSPSGFDGFASIDAFASGTKS